MDITVSEKFLEPLLPVAEKLKPLVPSIEDDIRASQMDIDPDTYLASALARALQMGLLIGAAAVTFGIVLDLPLFLKGGLIGAPALIVLMFFTFAYNPRVKANQRAREIEKNLPFALRHMLIEVSSGISLYEAMVGVSYDYGEASNEFQNVVSDVQGGMSQIEALEKSIQRNNSTMYRRAMWQMLNALKSGANLTETLESLVDNMVEQQKLEVEKYGEDLNPFILMYLMLAVIFPSLGVTLMIVLSSFTGLVLDKFKFLMIFGGLVVFQLFFLNLVKSQRPEVKAA
ncbi:MAG: type II secretion system F family protein [Candidatus Nanohaloarchaea archaeon]